MTTCRHNSRHTLLNSLMPDVIGVPNYAEVGGVDGRMGGCVDDRCMRARIRTNVFLALERSVTPWSPVGLHLPRPS